MRRWRGWGLDSFLVLLAAAEAVTVLLGDAPLPDRYLAAAFAAASALVLIGRRLQPLVASIVALAALAASIMLYGQHGVPMTLFIGLLVSFAIVAAINSTRDAVIAWAAGAVWVVAGTWIANPTDALGDALLTLALCTVMWVAGWLISRRTRQNAVMAIRLELAELERSRAVQNERSRIARELHDVVSHGLTVVIVQTLAARGTLSDLPGGPASDVDRHLASVESAARDALADMRRMLGLLQSDDGGEDMDPPSQGLHELNTLFERARAAGLSVADSGADLELRLSAGLELCVYRIVQEALTNAIKHASGAGSSSA